MSETRWREVDAYFDEVFSLRDGAAEEILERSAAAGLPAISVAANQGRLLELVARSVRARRILEIGTLGGYSAWWLCRALPEDGVLVSLEFDEHHATIARENLERAGVGHLVRLVRGPAVDSLRALIDASSEPFDVVFIDADKENYPTYFDLAMRLTHSGTVILADNVVRDGAVATLESDDPRVRGVREFCEVVARDERVRATAVQTVGVKGYDGFAYLLVK